MNRAIKMLRHASKIVLRDKRGVIGVWVKWPGGWMPVIQRFERGEG